MINKGIMFLSNELFEGGSEEVILNLAVYLQKKYNTYVASLNYGPILENFKNKNINIIKLNGNQLIDKLKSIRQAIYKYNIEYIFCNYIPIGHFLQLKGVSTIEIVHGPYPWLVGDPLYKGALLKCAKIVCVSAHVYDFMEENFNNIKDKMMVIENGISNDKLKTTISKEMVKEKYNIPSDSTVIGNIGRICPEKGIRRIIDIARILNQKYDNLYFLIAGDYNRNPDFYNEIKNTIANYHIKNIIFTGFTKNAADILQIFDIFVFPSYHKEGLQLALLEALKMGLPVVTSNVGVVDFDKDIEDGVSGYIIEKYNPLSFSNKISLLLDDQHLRNKMGKNNSSVFSGKYTAEEMAGHYQQLIESLAKGDKNEKRKT